MIRTTVIPSIHSHNSITAYDDIYFPMTVGKLPGANFPSWDSFIGNTYEYTFGVGDYIHLPSQEVLHKYKEGSSIEAHVHMVTNGLEATARYINYEIEYTIGNAGGVMSAATIITTGDYAIPANTPDRTHLYITFPTSVAGAGYQIGAAVKMRFRRIVLDDPKYQAPTDNPFVLMVGMHIFMDSIGSRYIATK